MDQPLLTSPIINEVRAADAGAYRTIYYSMNMFLEALGAARLDGIYLKWLNMIAKNSIANIG